MAYRLPPLYGADNASYRHGMTGTPTYISWQRMKDRCYKRSNISYPRYGAIGIRVCREWLRFDRFFADMGIRPPGHSLERIDSNGNYEPGNVRWATIQEQARNKRNVPLITAFNESLSSAEWAERFGVGASTIRYRLRRGWMPEDAVSIKPDPSHGGRKFRPA